MSPSDAALLDRWIVFRDVDAFQDHVIRHTAMVYGACLRVLNNAGDAEEVSQECFLELALKPARVRESVGGWLHGVATRKSLARKRSEGRRRHREHAFAAGFVQTRAAEWDDVRPHIDEAVAGLPPRLRETIVLRFFENEKHTEIAARLSVSEATVRYRIGKALERLRQTLAQRGVVSGVGALAALLAANAAEARPPASLMLSVGKDVLAHTAAKTGAVSSAAPVLVGEAIVVKKVLLVAAVAVIVLAAAVFTRSAHEPPRTEVRDAAAEVSSQESAVEPDSTPEVLQDVPSAVAESPGTYATEKATDGPPVGRISGKVVLATTGGPVPGCKMRVERYLGVSPYGGYKLLGWIAADAEGRFATDAPEATVYWFLPSDDVYAPVDRGACFVKLDQLGEIREDVVIEVAEGGVVEGRVYDKHTNAGVPGVEVQWEGGRFKTETDAKGRYRIGGLSARRQAFGLADTADYINNAIDGLNARWVEVKLGETCTLDFPLEKGVRARGIVLDSARKPVEGAGITLRPDPFSSDAETYAWGQTDGEGRFLLPGQPTGVEVMLSIGPPKTPENARGFLQYREKVDLADWRGERTFILGEACDLQANVVDAATGEPVRAFELARSGGDRELDVDLLNRFETYDTDDGCFCLKNIQIGQATIFVRAEGYAVGRAVIAAAKGGETIDLEIPLTRACRIEGVVLDLAGNPVPHAGVFVDDLPIGRHEQPDKYAPIKVDEHGRFLIDTLDAGKHTIHAVKDGFLPASQEVILDEGAPVWLELVLDDGGVVTGTATLDGEPVMHARLHMFVENRNLNAYTDSDGVYRISGLPDCEAYISVAIDVGGHAIRMRRAAEIAVGMETVVDFGFTTTSAVIEGTIRVDGAVSTETAWVHVTGEDGISVTGPLEGALRFRHRRGGRHFLR